MVHAHTDLNTSPRSCRTPYESVLTTSNVRIATRHVGRRSPSRNCVPSARPIAYDLSRGVCNVPRAAHLLTAINPAQTLRRLLVFWKAQDEGRARLLERGSAPLSRTRKQGVASPQDQATRRGSAHPVTSVTGEVMSRAWASDRIPPRRSDASRQRRTAPSPWSAP